MAHAAADIRRLEAARPPHAPRRPLSSNSAFGVASRSAIDGLRPETSAVIGTKTCIPSLRPPPTPHTILAVVAGPARRPVSSCCTTLGENVVPLDRQVGAADTSLLGTSHTSTRGQAASPNGTAALVLASPAVMEWPEITAPAKRRIGRILKDVRRAAATGSVPWLAALSRRPR